MVITFLFFIITSFLLVGLLVEVEVTLFLYYVRIQCFFLRRYFILLLSPTNGSWFRTEEIRTRLVSKESFLLFVRTF